jgi:hypothetical protein
METSGHGVAMIPRGIICPYAACRLKLNYEEQRPTRSAELPFRR